jgi:hypothetical protein
MNIEEIYLLSGPAIACIQSVFRGLSVGGGPRPVFAGKRCRIHAEPAYQRTERGEGQSPRAAEGQSPRGAERQRGRAAEDREQRTAIGDQKTVVSDQ